MKKFFALFLAGICFTGIAKNMESSDLKVDCLALAKDEEFLTDTRSLDRDRLCKLMLDVLDEINSTVSLEDCITLLRFETRLLQECAHRYALCYLTDEETVAFGELRLMSSDKKLIKEKIKDKNVIKKFSIIIREIITTIQTAREEHVVIDFYHPFFCKRFSYKTIAYIPKSINNFTKMAKLTINTIVKNYCLRLGFTADYPIVTSKYGRSRIKKPFCNFNPISDTCKFCPSCHFQHFCQHHPKPETFNGWFVKVDGLVSPSSFLTDYVQYEPIR